MNDHVLTILSTDYHLAKFRDEISGKTPLKNVILDMIKTEL
jgi:hypothetical protein